MGIRGLTTFINNRSHLYLEKYELYNTNVVIDGYSIASQLYNWHCKCNDCFGGDYDKYAEVVYQFFKLLGECNITPYVVLDGGYEKRKIATVITRMQNKIKSANSLDAFNNGSVSVFPLFLRDVFVDIVQELNLPLARCEFEGDTEIASLAKCLNCPVLSYDSDFYIFDVTYIPFITFEMAVKKHKTYSYHYIPCQVYRIDKFLDSFGGMDKSKLPILAVVMGNDYVKRKVFSKFFHNLKMQKCHGQQSNQQKRIKSVIFWLQNETCTSAIKQITGRYKFHKRKFILKNIRRAISGYYYVDSPLVQYFGVKPETIEESEILKLCNEEESLDENTDVDEDEDLDESFSESEDEEDLFDLINMDSPSSNTKCLPKIFKSNFQKCVYPSSFMDMIMQHKYYCTPQVEDSISDHSHIVSVELLQIMHKILIGCKNKNLTIYARNKNSVQKYVLPLYENQVPNIKQIEILNIDTKKDIFLKLIDVNINLDDLNSIPSKLHLMLFSCIYISKRIKINNSLIYALIICYVVLNYVDTKVGYCRSNKLFEKKYGDKVKNILNCHSPAVYKQTPDVTYDECLLYLEKVVHFFQMDIKMKSNRKLFDRHFVHLMSQFQSVLLHIKYLNSLLGFPFNNLFISKVFDGTFIYNVTKYLNKKSELENHIDLYLSNCPSILNLIKSITKVFKNQVCVDSGNRKTKSNKRRKKQKASSENHEEETNSETCEDEEAVFDPNNKFSVLADL